MTEQIQYRKSNSQKSKQKKSHIFIKLMQQFNFKVSFSKDNNQINTSSSLYQQQIRIQGASGKQVSIKSTLVLSRMYYT